MVVLWGGAVSYDRGTPVGGATYGGATYEMRAAYELAKKADLLVRIHFIIVMIRWTGLAPWEFEFPFPGNLTSTFLQGEQHTRRCARHGS